MKVPFLFSNGVLTLVICGMSKSVTKEHPRFKDIRASLNIEDGDESKLLAMIEDVQKPQLKPAEVVKPLADVVKDKVSIVGGRLFYGKEEITNAGLVNRIRVLQEQELPFDGMVKFIERLYDNMSFRTRAELLSFIDRNGLTIDSEGFILAYKAVKSNYFDKYSGTIDNSPGSVVSMTRGKVDDDFKSHCSQGLHAGSLDYIYWYGNGDDRIVIVKIDPADVVSVPEDHNCQKLRVCKYEVVGDYKGELKKVCYDASSSTEQMYVEDSDYEEEEDDFDWEDNYGRDDDDEDDYDYENEEEDDSPFYDDDEEEDEEFEDDFFNEGDVSSIRSQAVVEPVSFPSSFPYAIKPADCSQAGRKYWNKREKGRFVPRV